MHQLICLKLSARTWQLSVRSGGIEGSLDHAGKRRGLDSVVLESSDSGDEFAAGVPVFSLNMDISELALAHDLLCLAIPIDNDAVVQLQPVR